MITNAQDLILRFSEERRRLGLPEIPIQHECIRAPHKPPALLPQHGAVYVFSVSDAHGRACEAGPHRVLKVGKVGANSAPRFQYQHYSGGSAMSTLAGSIARSPILWSYLGIREIAEPQIGEWLRSNTDRDHFFIPGEALEAIDQLERYLKGRLGPAFEGGASAFR